MLLTLGIAGCASAPVPTGATTQPVIPNPIVDAGSAISHVVGDIGAVLTPFYPPLGSTLMGVGVIGGAVFDSLRQRKKVKKLSAPRTAWTAAQRAAFLAAQAPGSSTPSAPVPATAPPPIAPPAAAPGGAA